MTSNTLMIGQTLKVPSSETAGNTYTVKSGDSLWSIANKYNTTVNNLKTLNNLTSDSLQIGQILKIPGQASSSIPNVSENVYTVKYGDSLWSIANKYGTSVDTLKRLNNLTSNTLMIGQTLKLP